MEYTRPTIKHYSSIRSFHIQFPYSDRVTLLRSKRDTEVTIANAVLINDYEEGDSIKEGKEFAKTTAGNVNFHIYIDTDGYGWDYIDPRLVLY